MVIKQKLEDSQINCIKNFFKNRYKPKKSAAAWSQSSPAVRACRVGKTSKVATDKRARVSDLFAQPATLPYNNAASYHSWMVSGLLRDTNNKDVKVDTNNEDVEIVSGWEHIWPHTNQVYIWFRGELSTENIEKNHDQDARALREAGMQFAHHAMTSSGLKLERLPGKHFSRKSVPIRIKLKGESHRVTCKVNILCKDGSILLATEEKIIRNYSHDNPENSLSRGQFSFV